MAKKNKKGAQTQTSVEKPSSLTAKFSQFKDFFEESKVEIKKVVWPTRKETIATCVAVLVLVVVVSLFLSVVDMGISKAVQAILS